MMQISHTLATSASGCPVLQENSESMDSQIGDEIYALWADYEAQQTPESKFVKVCVSASCVSLSEPCFVVAGARQAGNDHPSAGVRARSAAALAFVLQEHKRRFPHAAAGRNGRGSAKTTQDPCRVR